MKNLSVRTCVRTLLLGGSLLLAGMAWGQTGNTQNLPNITLTNSSSPATTAAVSVSGNGVVRYTAGKPEPMPAGACVRITAQILRNNAPAATEQWEMCNSASRDIQVNHSGGNAQYALRLTKQDPWNNITTQISALKVFYPTSNTPVTLSTPGGLISLAPNNTETRNFTVPGAGMLMIRLKCSPSAPLLGVLRRGSLEVGRAQGSTGSVVLNVRVTSGGTYSILIQNLHQRTTVQASIDRVEYTPGS